MPKSQPKIILASSSPRRKEILSLLNIPFQTIQPKFDEISDNHLSPKDEVLSFAKGKARSISNDFKNAIVIGSDTLIDFKGEKIGKPGNGETAKRMLQRLQGKSHRIWTAVFLMDTSDGTKQFSVHQVKIHMFQMNKNEIDEYIKTGEPIDKAGGYAVQGIGRRFIRKLKGDKLAAIGLPLQTIVDFLSLRTFTFPEKLLENIRN